MKVNLGNLLIEQFSIYDAKIIFFEITTKVVDNCFVNKKMNLIERKENFAVPKETWNLLVTMVIGKGNLLLIIFFGPQ